jgi:hypothetical protein
MKTHITYPLLVSLFLYLIFIGASCESSDPIVGDPGVPVITNVSFKITALNVSSDRLSASGTVRNNSSVKITPPWNIEGQFYADSTLTLKLGGDVTRISVPLERGVETLWTLDFSSQNISEGNYPNFRVSGLRAYYNE